MQENHEEMQRLQQVDVLRRDPRTRKRDVLVLRNREKPVSMSKVSTRPMCVLHEFDVAV